MKAKKKLSRVVRGKRPQFFAAAGEDLSISMIMVLAQELCVLRNRLDAVETIATAKGTLLPAEVDRFVADDATLARQEEWRQDLLSRMFYLLKQQAAEAAGDDTDERFDDVIKRIAQP